MLRSTLSIIRQLQFSNNIHSKNFLTNAYRCSVAWNARTSSPILQKLNLEDFYNEIDRNYSSKGVMSAIDVDIFANSMKDGSYLGELRDLIHKLRLTADTGNMLPSTHYAAVRNFVEHGRVQDILNILWDPLNYGIFLDEFTANILMDDLLNREDFEKAAIVASLVMLQEEYNNDITCALALYSSYKYLQTFEPPREEELTIKTEEPKKGKKPKVEELKIRIKYLRNPFFDDHFDLTDHFLRAGKTLAWLSESKSDNNIHANLELMGWLFYKKYDKLHRVVKSLSERNSFKLYKEVLEALKKQKEEGNSTKIIEQCIDYLGAIPTMQHALGDDLKVLIENAVNKAQQNDIKEQETMFKKWEQLRQEKLAEQTKRLDEARRIQTIEEKQKALKEQEQKLWFFENEEKIDLEIENKIVYYPKKWFGKKRKPHVVDENYIPPEIK